MTEKEKQYEEEEENEFSMAYTIVGLNFNEMERFPIVMNVEE